MGMLDGGLQRMFGAAFSGIVLSGQLFQRLEDEQENGDVNTSWGRAIPIKGYREQQSERTRADLGYSSKEARLMVFQLADGRQVPEPKPGDRLQLDGRWIVGDDIVADAASVAWSIRATKDNGQSPQP
jgi:hypothetical protein